MRDVTVMWQHTRMVVLVALTAAAYVAILLPFKIATIVPGFTEIRPAAGIPVVFGLLFGPAAAWGAAFGNLVGDIFGGMLGPGSVFGVIGNFLLAYVPYRMWRALRGDRPADGAPGQLGWTALCAVAGALCCAVVIGTGVAALNLVPYGVLTSAITLNNGVIGTAVTLILLPILYPRAWRWGLVYSDILHPTDVASSPFAPVDVALTWLGGVVGSALSLYFFFSDLLAPGAVSALLPTTAAVPVGAVCSLLIVVGTVLMSPWARPVGASSVPEGAP